MDIDHDRALHREYINTSRQGETERLDAEMRLRRLTPQQVKNRQALLNKVRKFWIEGVLDNSLPDKVLIELGGEERADAVVCSQNRELKMADASPKSLPQGTKLISIFDQLAEGQALLILGEPGSGKTTSLLELTRDLLNRAEQGLDYRIPVVFNFSSWGLKQQTIADWLVVELNSKYQVPKAIGQDLLKRQELLLLLDGLDEVKAEHRDSCVAALNEFHQTYAPSIIVCSRLKAYSVLSKRLEFQRAIYLRSLTPEQIRHYLNSVNIDLTGLRALIEGDRALQELAKSPLMLNIMVLTYGGVTVEDLPKTEVVEERRKQLFDAYIERMFYRPTRVKMEPRYSPAQSIGWLTWLAQRMVQNSQTVFSIEEMQPTWLPTTGKRIVYRMVILLINGLIFGLISWLIFGDLFGWDDGLIIGLVLGIISIWEKADIKLVDSLNWSWRIAIKLLIFGLIFGLILGLICGLIIEQISLNIWLTIWGVTGLFGGIILGLSKGLDIEVKRSLIATKVLPNQGIYRTAISAVIISFSNGLMSLFFVLITGLNIELTELIRLRDWRIVGLISGLEDWLILGLIVGLIGGLISLFLGDGKACIQHLTLRLIFYRDGYIPWNYARFLDYATDRIFLQKVGGGYIFIHRLLLEHFAQMECGRSR